MYKINNMKYLGFEIKRARKLAKITQEEMAEKVGVCAVTIGSLEQGKSVATSTLFKVLEVLNLHLEVHKN